MRNLFFVAISVLSLSSFTGGAEGDKTTVSKAVQVLDADTGQPLIGAGVRVSGSDEIFYTDPDGFIHFNCVADQDVKIQISYISYRETVLNLGAKTNYRTVNLISR